MNDMDGTTADPLNPPLYPTDRSKLLRRFSTVYKFVFDQIIADLSSKFFYYIKIYEIKPSVPMLNHTFKPYI